jgi:hypothetical protein
LDFEDFDSFELLGGSLIDLGRCRIVESTTTLYFVYVYTFFPHLRRCGMLEHLQEKTSFSLPPTFPNPRSVQNLSPCPRFRKESNQFLRSLYLSISLFLSFSLSYIISPKTKERPTANLTSSNQNIASDGIHPLRAKLHNDLQQLPRDLAILLLQRLPRLRRKQPSNAIQLRDDTTRALRAAEKGQLATRRARHNALVVVALLEVVLGAQDPGLQQVEAVGGVAARVQHLAAREDAAGEVGHDAEPEVFGAGGEVLEGLEEEGEGLLEVAPFGGGRGRGFGDCCGGGAVQELAAGGADHLVEGGD